ncbi:MAG: tetratricopeptide repeat protein [Planctomycetes bacterium]|nr:tetratricopeptide repeat protein [Planctomycetota bacterium]
MSEPSSRARVAVALGLAAATFGLYARTLGHDFVHWDDTEYVAENALVARGLTLDGLRFAFTHAQTNYHPLTWLSHMLDCELFGLAPGAHHAVSALLHALAAVVLLHALHAASRAFWPSAWVAALFAFHPAHVESVAWVAERKDVLAALFGFATLGLWVRWTRARRPATYGAALACFALGLLSKPTLVSWPFVLVLVDLWPLERRGLARLVVEKLPFFALAGVASAVTLFAQHAGGAVADTEQFGVGVRVANALVSYAVYVRQFFAPIGLAVFNPHPGEALSTLAIAGSAALVLGASACAWRRRTRAPWLAVGLAWFLGVLVPMIGLVQVGAQAHADRYTYLAHVGLSIAVAFGGAELVRAGRIAADTAKGLAVAWLAVLAVATVRQVETWRDTGTLLGAAVVRTGDDSLARAALGDWLTSQGRAAEAIEHLRVVVAAHPRFGRARRFLVGAYLAAGRGAEALALAEESAALEPDDATAWQQLATTRIGVGDVDGSLAASARALELRPDWAAVARQRGFDLWLAGRVEEAVAAFRRARELAPESARGADEFETDSARRADEFGTESARAADELASAERLLADPDAHSPTIDAFRGALTRDLHALAALRWRAGRAEEAAESWRRAAELAATRAEAESYLGWAELARGEPSSARRHFQAALALAPDDPAAREGLRFVDKLGADR